MKTLDMKTPNMDTPNMQAPDMDEAIIDIRNADAMELLFDEEAMAIWELLRRRGDPLPPAEVARITGFDFQQAQRRLDWLQKHGLVVRLPARASAGSELPMRAEAHRHRAALKRRRG